MRVDASRNLLIYSILNVIDSTHATCTPWINHQECRYDIIDSFLKNGFPHFFANKIYLLWDKCCWRGCCLLLIAKDWWKISCNATTQLIHKNAILSFTRSKATVITVHFMFDYIGAKEIWLSDNGKHNLTLMHGFLS